jgi:hypothetical protein
VNRDDAVLDVLREAAALAARDPALSAAEAIHKAVATRPDLFADPRVEIDALRGLLALLGHNAPRMLLRIMIDYEWAAECVRDAVREEA